jgi:AcrR family transcriptional regulator
MKRSAPKRRKRTQEERSASTKNALLAAAVNCIAQRGLAGATVPEIVKTAGLTTGAVQHHFGSREDLLIGVVYAFADTISKRGRPPGLEALPIRDRIAVICRDIWDAFSSAEYIAVTEIQLGSRSQRGIFSKIQTVMWSAERDLDNYWIEAFAESGIEPPKLVAARHLFQAAFRGLALRGVYKLQPESWPEERLLLEDLICSFFGIKA